MPRKCSKSLQRAANHLREIENYLQIYKSPLCPLSYLCPFRKRLSHQQIEQTEVQQQYLNGILQGVFAGNLRIHFNFTVSAIGNNRNVLEN